MSADWVRQNYHVPAKRGGRVAYTGDPDKGRQLGTITRFSNSVHVRLDGEKHSAPYHPTWKLEYLPRAAWTLTADNLWQVLSETDKCGLYVAKPHYSPAPPGSTESLIIDGITAKIGDERIWVRFGDTIALDQLGHWTVTRPTDSQEA